MAAVSIGEDVLCRCRVEMVAAVCVGMLFEWKAKSKNIDSTYFKVILFLRRSREAGDSSKLKIGVPKSSSRGLEFVIITSYSLSCT